MTRTTPTRDPLLSPAAMRQTADFIAGCQAADGQIPWFPGGHTDPWDHVEAAMGLDVAGRHAQARRAYEWLRAVQNSDGSWYHSYRGDDVVDRTREANFAAYLAVGLWHHFRSTGDAAFLDRMWPTLEAAVAFVLTLQQPGGQIGWAHGAGGEALLTGCASMHHSLACALAIANERGAPQPDWELAAATLGHAVAEHPERFSPRDRYSMDWYYPVLGGALRGAAGLARIDREWDRFVVPGLGARCVSDRPWVTVAETCELVLALCCVGDTDRAVDLFAAIQRMRLDDGSYWTGYVYPDDTMWPQERTTWSAAAVLLGSAMIAGEPATTATFATVPELMGGRDRPSAVCDFAACPAQLT
ncbi:MAG TPA: prenyltransferase/squalene oxidase repeat-containing protein [Pilimelia sp.]|nr:prenyltransferase/squalene oxidase repeat-containing protein [Pilimelia sp.]